MFRGIFNKKQAGSRGERQGRPASSAAPNLTGVSEDVGTHPAVTIDEVMVTLSRELSGLKETNVPQSAKERGWAAMQRELERHPVRPSVVATRPPAKRSARRGMWPWALGSAAAAVAVIATLIGTYSGGLLTTVENTSSTVVTVVSSDTTDKPTTSLVDGTTLDSITVTTDVVPSTGGTQPGTTQTSGTTVNTGTTGSSTGSTTGTSNPTTTQPSSPTTTGEQQNAAKQREGSARTAARYLADAVITGNTSGARSIVSPDALSSLSQMISSLQEPYGYTIDSEVQTLSGNVIRVTMAINDRVIDGQGELKEVLKHFAIKVRVDDAGAVIIAINEV